MGITSALLRMFARSNLSLNPIPGLTRSISSSNSPWLMLRPQPEIESGDMVHRFYNVEDDKVSWVGKLRGFGKSSRIVGSSHGWLALFNLSTGCLHLTDPVNDGNEVELPPVHTAPDSDDWVYRVIISSSTPGDGECRALMIYGPDRKLASCVPKHSKKWSPVNPPHLTWRYEDFAYSNTRRAFICLAYCECPKGAGDVVVSLDLSKAAADDDDAQMTTILAPSAGVPDYINRAAQRCDHFHIFDERRHSWPGRFTEESEFKTKDCIQFKYLVLDEDEDSEMQLYVVVRHVIPQVSPTGYPRGRLYISKEKGWDVSLPYKTIDFDVYKVDMDRNEISHEDTLDKVDMDRNEISYEDTLDGLALFVGINHPFAVRPVVGESRLQPNSIYFTDLTDHLSWYHTCHDNGVFDYKSRTFSPCHPEYPIDLREIKQTKRSPEEILTAPLPLWYTPRD